MLCAANDTCHSDLRCYGRQVMKSFLKKMPKPADIVSVDWSPVVQNLQRNLLLMRYENDRLEQYSRRETIKVVGLKVEEGEDTEQKVLDIFKAVGADITPADVSVVHRTGDRKRKGWPILVRFVSRKKRKAVMQKKKVLKDKLEYTGVYVFDDLTTLRAKLLYYLKKKVPVVENAWTIDGRIHCTKKRPPGLSERESLRRIFTINTPDDLFKLGVDAVDFEELGLADLFCI